MKIKKELQKIGAIFAAVSLLPLAGCGNLVTLSDRYLSVDSATLPSAAQDASAPALQPAGGTGIAAAQTAAAAAAGSSAVAQTAAGGDAALVQNAAAQTAAAGSTVSQNSAEKTAAGQADPAGDEIAAASQSAADAVPAGDGAAAASQSAADAAAAGDGAAAASQSAADAVPAGDGAAAASQSAADAYAAGDTSASGLPLTPLYAEYSVFLSRLSEDERTDFYAIYRGLMSFAGQIDLPVALPDSEVSKLLQLMVAECPELLQFGSSWQQSTDLHSNVRSVIPTYALSEEETAAQYATVSALIDSFHAQLDGYDQYQTELAIYNYIIEHCVYSTTSSYASTAFGALVDGSAKCDGRAKAMVWVLRSFGIESSVLTGSDHAWVILNIDGTYCNTDPTFDDNESGGSQRPCSYAYFNVPQSAIADDPYPADELYTDLGIPDTVSWAQNYHVRSGFWIASGQDASALFQAQTQAALQAGAGLISIRFENPADYAAASAASASWLQSALNWGAASCSVTTYDYSDDNLLFLELQFQNS